ncbi:MAG TPA: hypothetical protein VMT85_17160 [Thermoanaerobaculia bacterium]|nr:hypothetical protein [Thermoanaerobaculia bacterium]
MTIRRVESPRRQSTLELQEVRPEDGATAAQIRWPGGSETGSPPGPRESTLDERKPNFASSAAPLRATGRGHDADRLRRNTTKPITRSDQCDAAKIGSPGMRDGTRRRALLGEADRALRSAKANGKDRVTSASRS